MGVKKTEEYSIQDYLLYEEESEVKHEYEQGSILAMSGGTFHHGLICGNVYNALRRAIEDKKLDCTPIGSEVRIHIELVDAIVYPDSMVICGPVEFSENDPEAVINPTLIVEVLSKSTGNYDRGDKFFKYRQLPAFKEYLLVNQDEAVAEIYFKGEGDFWKISRVAGLDQWVEFNSLDIRIKMEQLYVNVRWD